MKKRFTLEREKWYAWQMFPGYADFTYFSPIYVHEVVPRKTGKGVFTLKFHNAFYAQGVQHFESDLHTLKRCEDYLLCEPASGDENYRARSMIITSLTRKWLETFCPHLIERYSLSHAHSTVDDIQHYMNLSLGKPQY